MSNTALKIAVVLMTLSLPATAFAQRGAASSGASISALNSRGALLGAAQMLDQSEQIRPSAVAPIPPPRIEVPKIPQFK